MSYAAAGFNGSFTMVGDAVLSPKGDLSSTPRSATYARSGPRGTAASLLSVRPSSLLVENWEDLPLWNLRVVPPGLTYICMLTLVCPSEFPKLRSVVMEGRIRFNHCREVALLSGGCSTGANFAAH